MAIARVATLTKVPSTKINQIIDEVNGLSLVYQVVTSTALGTTATNLGTPQGFPAVSYASTIEALFVGFVNNTSANSRTPVSDVGITGTGTAMSGVDGFGFLSGATTAIPVTLRAVFTVPASTVATVTIAAHIATAATSVLVAGGVTFRQTPA